ncbi:hypothetical protein D9M71_693930 [compost metagenome]
MLHVEGFTQRIGQFLPARCLFSGTVPVGQLVLSKRNEQQREVVVEHLGDRFDVDVKMHHGRGLWVCRQEVFALKVVGASRGKKLMHERLSQRLESGRQGHELTVERLPLRRADHCLVGVEIPFGIQRFEGLAQHLSGDFVDGRPLARLVHDQAFFQQDRGLGIFDSWGHRHFPF